MMTENEKGLIGSLESLGCKGLAERLEKFFDTKHVSAENLMELLAFESSEEVVRIKQIRAERLLKRAGLFNTYANIDLLEYSPERHLDKILVERLSSCDFIRDYSNVIIVGAAGTGKTFLARALAVNACNNGIRTNIYGLRSLLRELAIREKEDPYGFEKRMKFLGRIPLLVLDEWFSISPTKNELVILHELIDSRYGRTSTIICSQMPSENWPIFCGNAAIGEAIKGRLLAKSFVFSLEGEDLRTKHFQRP